MFEDRILGLSNSRYKNLQRPAEIAAAKPDTCVKILNKSAYYVIKDCAEITLKYLPHFVYSGIRDPLTKLRGVVTQQDVVDFATRASKEDHTQQLLRLVLDDITRSAAVVSVSIRATLSDDDIDFTLTGDESDVYGDYDYTSPATTQQEPEVDQVPEIANITDVESVIKVLNRAFVD